MIKNEYFYKELLKYLDCKENLLIALSFGNGNHDEAQFNLYCKDGMHQYINVKRKLTEKEIDSICNLLIENGYIRCKPIFENLTHWKAFILNTNLDLIKNETELEIDMTTSQILEVADKFHIMSMQIYPTYDLLKALFPESYIKYFKLIYNEAKYSYAIISSFTDEDKLLMELNL